MVRVLLNECGVVVMHAGAFALTRSFTNAKVRRGERTELEEQIEPMTKDVGEGGQKSSQPDHRLLFRWAFCMTELLCGADWSATT